MPREPGQESNPDLEARRKAVFLGEWKQNTRAGVDRVNGIAPRNVSTEITNGPFKGVEVGLTQMNFSEWAGSQGKAGAEVAEKWRFWGIRGDNSDFSLTDERDYPSREAAEDALLAALKRKL